MLLKGREELGHIPASQLAAMLHDRRRAIQDYLCTARDVADRIRAYETRYERSTAEMFDDLRSGELEESWEITDWVMLHDRYRAITQDWPSMATAELAR